jgi:hypothetical protein
MNKILDIYKLIGIGEFSHGIQESWKLKFNLLKHLIRTTNKNIYVFNEMSIWQANNVMNNDKIKIEKPFQTKNYVGGKLWKYIFHASESKIFYDIIKYVRKHKTRIKLIGVDNDKIDRDYDMYKIIINNLYKNNINLFWAHNSHVDDRELTSIDMNYIKNKKHKWTAGHYLKEDLKNKYCIILTQAYSGTNRYNSYCYGKYCSKRVWTINYFYKDFKYEPNKKYINKKLLTKFDNKLIEFSNSYYKPELVESDKWNYIVFWNKVHKLEKF